MSNQSQLEIAVEYDEEIKKILDSLQILLDRYEVIKSPEDSDLTQASRARDHFLSHASYCLRISQDANKHLIQLLNEETK